MDTSELCRSSMWRQPHAESMGHVSGFDMRSLSREVAMARVSENGCALASLPEELRGDREIVLKAGAEGQNTPVNWGTMLSYLVHRIARSKARS